MGLSELTGRFNEFRAEVDLDENNITKLEVKIASSSIDTGNRMRDGHLKGHDFFQSTHHPYILFSSQNIKQIGTGKFRALGELTIKGITRPSTIDFSITDSLKDTWGYENKFVKFKSSVGRKDYNIKWNKTLDNQQFLVGDVIDFWGTFQIQPMNIKTPSTKHMIPDTGYIRNLERVTRGEPGYQESNRAFVMPAPAKITEKVEQRTMPQTVQKVEDFRDSTIWWASFVVIGLFGFFSVILFSLYSKNILANYFPKHYVENGTLGLVSDSVVIVLVIIYSVALWFLGWGIR